MHIHKNTHYQIAAATAINTEIITNEMFIASISIHFQNYTALFLV